RHWRRYAPNATSPARIGLIAAPSTERERTDLRSFAYCGHRDPSRWRSLVLALSKKADSSLETSVNSEASGRLLAVFHWRKFTNVRWQILAGLSALRTVNNERADRHRR